MRGRGVAIKDGRLVRGTPDGYLVSLNAADGTLLWARRVAKSEDGETFSMAPLVFEDLGDHRPGRQREQPAGLGGRVPVV